MGKLARFTKAAAVAAVTAALSASAPAQAAPANVVLQWDDQAWGFVQAIEEVAYEYDLQHITVTSAQLRYGVYAGSKLDGTIVVSRTYSTNPAHWQNEFNEDMREGFHKASPCDAQRFTGFHEAAHQIDFRDDMMADWEVAHKYGDGRGLPLSGYSFHSDGSIDTSEALADAFAAVKCGVGNDVEQDLFVMLTT